MGKITLLSVKHNVQERHHKNELAKLFEARNCHMRLLFQPRLKSGILGKSYHYDCRGYLSN